MIIEQISMVARRGHRRELSKAVASLVGPIQVQPGCLSCSILRLWSNLDELRIEAHWENEDDLVRHLQSEMYKNLLLLMELSPVPPVLAFYTVLEVQGLDLIKAVRAPSL